MDDLDLCQADLDQLRSGAIGAAAFSDRLRNRDTLLVQLPERYAQVLVDLLDRLESSALFTDESCSFSQSGLLENLQVWIDKARRHTAKASRAA